MVKSYYMNNELDRGAGFISTGQHKLWEAAVTGKGIPPKEFTYPDVVPGTQAEDAADCHNSGALSVV